MLKKYLIPDVFYDNIYQITPEYLLGEGVKALVLDIDNTLVTYDDPEPTESVLEWLRSMEEAGISIAFVSNNKPPRVERFNSKLGYFARAKGGKPFTKNIKRAMVHMGVTRNETALIGDQLLTDVLAARSAKLRRAFLVKPIKDKTDAFTRSKRMLEKPFIKKYYKMQDGEK